MANRKLNEILGPLSESFGHSARRIPTHFNIEPRKVYGQLGAPNHTDFILNPDLEYLNRLYHCLPFAKGIKNYQGNEITLYHCSKISVECAV